ncbi:uncharacterized protein LOC110466529 isoform X1 [Mizuhopecten yessoensis]|uniref:Uncharacterized protein n=1 Tax=Mizuhopecten yessoensis TaxID=6573 RepID=A0A210PP10_MIZYE|nr:uncharacterized protein LOC110466529 isoform X1 [Mizuhopecten yessoensis]OWF38239.1 hypothetical protein KP79_PYT10614 [Mizuhopecten yessoensis]
MVYLHSRQFRFRLHLGNDKVPDTECHQGSPMGSTSSVKRATRPLKDDNKPVQSQRPVRLEQIEERTSHGTEDNKKLIKDGDVKLSKDTEKSRHRRLTKDDTKHTPFTKDESKYTQDHIDKPTSFRDDTLYVKDGQKSHRRYSQYDVRDSSGDIRKDELLYEEDDARDAMLKRRYGKRSHEKGEKIKRIGDDVPEVGEENDITDELRKLIEKRHRSQRYSLPPGRREPPREAPRHRTRPERIVSREPRGVNFAFWGMDGVTF